MKNTKEIQSILAVIFCINFTSENKDTDISTIIDYAFHRIFNANTNLLILSCIGKTKAQVMPEIMEVLETDTQYKQHLEKLKEIKNNGK